MKLSKRKLRQIIIEERRKIIEGCGDPQPQQPVSLEKDESGPCPYSTASDLKSSGMSDSEVIEWVSKMLSTFLSGNHNEHSHDTRNSKAHFIK